MRTGKPFGVLFVDGVDLRRGERRASGFNHEEPTALNPLSLPPTGLIAR